MLFQNPMIQSFLSAVITRTRPPAGSLTVPEEDEPEAVAEEVVLPLLPADAAVLLPCSAVPAGSRQTG